jgi:polar amino acid transport system substrate-binding protein
MLLRSWHIVLFFAVATAASADTLETIRQRGRLIWGADAEGGGPYVYSDPANPKQVTGFEVEIANLLARELGVKAQYFQGAWETLPALLDSGEIDIILNGYELTPSRAGTMDYCVPYYIYQLSLLGRKDNVAFDSWEDLRRPISGHKPQIGVLGGSAADQHLHSNYAGTIEIVEYDGNTNAMQEVETGKLDGTVADNVVEIFYRDRFPKLKLIGQPIGRGYYVIYVRQGDNSLRKAIDAALVKLLRSGELEQVLERYGLWNDTQEQLLGLAEQGTEALGIKATRLSGWQVIRSRGPLLVESAWMTVKLACLSMPLAIALGLAIALVRMYGPLPLRWLSVAYVEILRGTPLMLQLYVLFFILPEIGWRIPAFAAAIAGLAINYSAYEAEIYRAGLQAIPRGQMEAALALGMTPALALRRIIVPQAVRIVVPPVTNDFIALFKDTSVCSVITVVELTKRYNMQVNDTGATLELAALTALLYLLMSIPLAQLANYLERRTRTHVA